MAGGPVLNIRGLIYDSSNDVLGDPRIRQALNLAIDRQAIVDGLYYGKTNVPHDWQMDVFGDMYLADRPVPEFNLDRAKALLKDAGYKGQEIVYRSQQAYYTNQGPTAQILVSMWKKAGLNVRLDMKENWGQIMEDTDDRHIFDGSFSAYYPDPVGQVWRRFGPNGSWAQKGIYANNPEFLEAASDGFLVATIARGREGTPMRAFGPGTSEIEMPVTTALTFDGTLVQGGLVGALLDIAGGAAALTLTPEGQTIRTLGFETHHLGPAGGERLVARGTVIKPGRNQALSRVDIHAVDGTRESLCATGLVTSCWVPLPA